MCIYALAVTTTAITNNEVFVLRWAQTSRPSMVLQMPNLTVTTGTASPATLATFAPLGAENLYWGMQFYAAATTNSFNIMGSQFGYTTYKWVRIPWDIRCTRGKAIVRRTPPALHTEVAWLC